MQFGQLLAKFTTNASSATWWPKFEIVNITRPSGKIWSQWEYCRTLKTLPEAQWTQGIDFVFRFFSTTCFHFNFRDNLRYGVNTLGPLCLWQCLKDCFPYKLNWNIYIKGYVHKSEFGPKVMYTNVYLDQNPQNSFWKLSGHKCILELFFFLYRFGMVRYGVFL